MISYGIYAGMSALSAWSVVASNRVFKFAFAAFLVWFVAFRFETGYDWPVYKALFHELQQNASWETIKCLSDEYHQERLFVALLGGMSHVLWEYELTQAVFSVFFLASIWYLGRAFKLNNITLFVAIALSYIVFTVGFSTVRQSVAIALFNFAVGSYVYDRKFRSLALMVLAVLFQFTAILYVAAFAFTALTARYKTAWFDLIAASAIVVAGICVGAFFLFLAREGVTFNSERIAYYVNVITARGISKWDWLFSIVLLGITCHVLLSIHFGNRSDLEILASRMTVVLGAGAVSAILVPIVRERASYEMWVLYAVFLGFNTAPLRKLATASALSFAAVYAVLVPFKYPSTMMFVPYQNYLLEKLNVTNYAPRRYDAFMSEYVALMLPSSMQQSERKGDAHQPETDGVVAGAPSSMSLERTACADSNH